ncbi:MAG: hypothetical protein RLZZ162_3079, partial [Verrucomicrobiota bacterium]
PNWARLTNENAFGANFTLGIKSSF